MVDPYWARVCGPLEPYAEGLRGELQRLGYTPLSAAGQVRLVAHLSRWMIREGLSVSALTPTMVDAYFAERRASYYNSLTARSLRPLLDYLQELGRPGGARSGGLRPVHATGYWTAIASTASSSEAWWPRRSS